MYPIHRSTIEPSSTISMDFDRNWTQNALSRVLVVRTMMYFTGCCADGAQNARFWEELRSYQAPNWVGRLFPRRPTRNVTVASTNCYIAFRLPCYSASSKLQALLTSGPEWPSLRSTLQTKSSSISSGSTCATMRQHRPGAHTIHPILITWNFKCLLHPNMPQTYPYYLYRLACCTSSPSDYHSLTPT